MPELSLSGRWNLRRSDECEAIPANIPGDNYSALLAAGRIPDPYFGKNEDAVQWVRTHDWVYSRTFEVPENLLSCASVFLNAEMLDTFADVQINGEKVFSADNMFARWRVEVKPFLKKGSNTIELYFHSAEKIGRLEAEKLPFPIPQVNNIKVPHQNLLRKQQCSGGWDWGITLLSCGVSGDLSLIGVNTFRIESVRTEQAFRKNLCEVTAVAEVFALRNTKTTLRFSFHDESASVCANVREGLNEIRHTFVVVNPQLWYPNGYGEAKLYRLEVASEDETVVRKIGLRKLEIDLSKNESGRALTVRVNDIPIFCKGASWIPADAFPERITRDRLDDLLESARLAHMNMLRVWGGGRYESDDFYELCDEKGILIWQDMMFSCSLYPSTPEFIAKVEHELDFQIRRLRPYPCIALWCGDNELIGALNWYDESRENREKYLLNYDRLNRVLARKVSELDPERLFWPSSPCAGPDDLGDTFHNDGSGDMHYWEVWFSDKTFDAYYTKKPRFCSEFGYQSFPSLETVESYADPSQFNVFSPVMDHHQKCSLGNAPIIGMFGRYFRMPTSFASFLYLSQVQQALAIKTGVEYWRSIKPVCMGTLFWQLNDNWPLASWSSVEYNGHWKQLQYHAKRFYAPLAVVARPEADGSVVVSAVSDWNTPRQVRLEMKVLDFDGAELRSFHAEAALPPLSAENIRVLTREELDFDRSAAFMTLRLESEEGESHENTFFFDVFKHCDLRQAHVSLTSIREDGDSFLLELSTDKPAFFVCLETPGIPGLFSDNSLTMLPGRNYELRFSPRIRCTASDLEKALTIQHLRDSYE